MAPGYNARLANYEAEVEYRTRWWSDYPVRKFADSARPTETFDTYVGEVFQRPKKLVRSASATSLTYIKEAEPGELPIRKVPSVSNLSPSHALPYDDRVPHRYISSIGPRKLHSDSRWYTGAYAPTTWRQLHDDLAKEPRKTPVYSSHTPYYSRIANKSRWVTPPSMTSYLQGSLRHMDRYVSHRVRAWDFALPFVHNSYEYARPSTHSFDRHFMLGSQVFVSVPSGVPRYYRSAWSPRKAYRVSHRVIPSLWKL